MKSPTYNLRFPSPLSLSQTHLLWLQVAGDTEGMNVSLEVSGLDSSHSSPCFKQQICPWYTQIRIVVFKEVQGTPQKPS